VMTATFESISVTSSTLTVSPALMFDSTSYINVKASTFQSIKVASSDLIVIKKPI
jgi:hypothetical protein